MNFSYNVEVDKSRQIIIAIFAPLILAGLVFFVKHLFFAETIAKDSEISFGIYSDYIGPNPLLIPTLDSVLSSIIYGLVALAVFLPSLIFLRNKPIERTELNLSSK
jgi:hypothetical protein